MPYGAEITLVLYLADVKTPELGTAVTPASTASGQPSPSESRSKRFGIPSPSVSKFSFENGGALVHKYPEPASITNNDKSVGKSFVCAIAIVCVVAVATNDKVIVF